MSLDIKKVVTLIESKKLEQLSEAVELLLHDKNNITNIDNIFDLIGNVLMLWSNTEWVGEDRKLIGKCFSDIDELVEICGAVVSTNEAFISGLAQFINYCISKLALDDIVDSHSMDNPQCDEALLVFCSTLVPVGSMIKVLRILTQKRLCKEFIKRLCIVVKHGESFASQEFALGILTKICIYDNTLKNPQYSDLILSSLPDKLTTALKVRKFRGCTEVYNNMRPHLNIVNKDNVNVESFFVKAFYAINASGSRQNGTPLMFDLDSMDKKLLGENIWLDIERRSIVVDQFFNCHVSELRNVNFGKTLKIMNFTAEFDQEPFPLVAEYAMIFEDDTNLKHLSELIKLKLAKSEQESTLKVVKDTFQKTIEVPPTNNNNFDDDISECTDETFDNNKNTPLTKPVNTKKLVTTLKSANKAEVMPVEKIQKPADRVKYGKNAIAAKKKANIVSDLKVKQKVTEEVDENMKTRSSKRVENQTSPVNATLPPPPAKSARKIKEPINPTAESPETKQIDQIDDRVLMQTVAKSAVMKTPLAPLVKSKMRSENLTEKENKEVKNKSEVKNKIEKTSKGNKENKSDKVLSSMRSVSNEENDENVNPFLNAHGSRQKVKRTPLSSPLSSVKSNRVMIESSMIESNDPLSHAKKTEVGNKNSRISLQRNVTEGIDDSQDSFLEKETKKVNASKSEKLRIQKGPISIVKNDMTSLARLSTLPTEILEETMDIHNESVALNINFENNELEDSYYLEDSYTENSYKYTESSNQEEQVNYMMEHFSQSNLSLDKLLSDRGESQMQDDFSEDSRGDSSSEGEENILSVLVTELTSLKKSKRDKKIRKSLGGAIENAETQVGNFLTQWSEYRKSKFSLIESQIQYNLSKICKSFDEIIETHSSEISKILTEDRELEDRRKIVQHDCKEFVKEIKKEAYTISQDINSVQNYLTKRKIALLSELEKENKMHHVKKSKTHHR
jgi:hypothetical protein